MRARCSLLTAVSAVGLLTLTGCVANSGSDSLTDAISVESSADQCTVSANEAPAGNIRFEVTNTGDEVTEFYLLGSNERTVVSEVENIGPGLSRDLVVELEAGTYFTLCKPGMTGEGIGKSTFTVTESDSADRD